MKIYTNADGLPKDIVEYIKSWSIIIRVTDSRAQCYKLE